MYSLIHPPSKGFQKWIQEKENIIPEKMKNHPQEDFLLISDEYPIYVIADGVTLSRDSDNNYPNPSGAFKVAQIFCNEVIRLCEGRYDDINETVVRDIFREANNVVGEYNEKMGRRREISNFWDFDLFACAAAFVVIKENIAYWARIADCLIVNFDKKGIIKTEIFEDFNILKTNAPSNYHDLDRDTRLLLEREKYRNVLDADGNLFGYGVVDGEDRANRYLVCGSFEVKKGDLLVLGTDGFEPYFKIPEFVFSIRNKEEIEEISKLESEEIPNKLGKERSLIVAEI